MTLGVPSFALSQGYGLETRQKPHWDTALRHGPEVIRKVLKEGIPQDVLVNAMDGSVIGGIPRTAAQAREDAKNAKKNAPKKP